MPRCEGAPLLPSPSAREILCARTQVEAENAKRKAKNESGGKRQPLLQPYILVMPQGERDLAVVALKERLKLPDIHRIMGQIAEALAYLHSKGLAHADVKLLVRVNSVHLHTSITVLLTHAYAPPLFLSLARALSPPAPPQSRRTCSASTTIYDGG